MNEVGSDSGGECDFVHALVNGLRADEGGGGTLGNIYLRFHEII